MTSRNPADIIRDFASDDWFGLWEVISALSSRDPAHSEVEHIKAASEAIAPLIQSGEIVLIKCVRNFEDHAPLSVEDALTIVCTVDAWHEPRGGPFYAFGAA